MTPKAIQVRMKAESRRRLQEDPILRMLSDPDMLEVVSRGWESLTLQKKHDAFVSVMERDQAEEGAASK